MKKLLLILLMTALTGSAVSAQSFLKTLGERAKETAKNAIENKVEEKAANAVDKAADKTEETAAGIFNSIGKNAKSKKEKDAGKSKGPAGSTSYNSEKNSALEYDDWDLVDCFTLGSPGGE